MKLRLEHSAMSGCLQEEHACTHKNSFLANHHQNWNGSGIALSGITVTDRQTHTHTRRSLGGFKRCTMHNSFHVPDAVLCLGQWESAHSAQLPSNQAWWSLQLSSCWCYLNKLTFSPTSLPLTFLQISRRFHVSWIWPKQEMLMNLENEFQAASSPFDNWKLLQNGHVELRNNYIQPGCNVQGLFCALQIFVLASKKINRPSSSQREMMAFQSLCLRTNNLFILSESKNNSTVSTNTHILPI